MKLITTTDALASQSQSLRAAPFITVDTEFMREKTYYAQLCLVQVATENDAFLIDPLSNTLDLAPLLDVFADTSVLKVFHAARQDIEILYRLMGEVPKPLFDTQVAAMACGYGDQVGYEPLVRAVTNAAVDKGSRFTDWSKRPLSEKQMRYALGDVTHLVDVYKNLRARLDAEDRTAWVEEEMSALTDPKLYYVTPEEAWQRLKTRNVKPRDMGVLIEIAAWREREAQSRDLPRSRILKDDVLYEIARAAPTTVQDLGALRGIPNGFERSKSGASLIEAISTGKAVERRDLPRKAEVSTRQSAPPDVLELLRVLLKTQSERHGVAPKLLASAADLEAIALDDHSDVPALSGWRREVFGQYALDLKNGKIALGLDGKTVTVISR